MASLGALYRLVIQVAATLRGDVAFPELFGPLQVVASKVSLVLLMSCTFELSFVLLRAANFYVLFVYVSL